MKNPIGIGLAIVATAAFASAHGDGPVKNGKGHDDPPATDNLFQDGLKITYKPGGGILFDGGDEFALRMSGRIQAQWAYSATENQGSYNSFELRRARLKFDGHVWSKDITYYLQTDFTESPSIKDARIGWRFLNNDHYTINGRIGLQKMRASLQSDLSSANMVFPERSIATRTFADARAAGALFEGGLMKNDNGDRLMWHVGIFNNDTAAGSPFSNPTGPNEGNRLDYTLGVLYDFRGGKTNEHYSEGDLEHSGNMDGRVGASIAVINDRFAAGQLIGVATPGSDDAWTINVLGALKSGGGLAAQGELFFRKDKPESAGADADLDSMGWYAQGSYTTAPGEGTQYGLAARVGMVNFKDDFGGNFMVKPGQPFFSNAVAGFSQGDVLEVNIAASAYYHQHKLKTQLAYTYMDVSPDAGTGSGAGAVDSQNHGIDLLFTLLF